MDQFDSGMELLQQKHVASVILFLNARGPQRKTEIYESISRASSMRKKLDSLEDLGIIAMEARGNNEIYSLTARGKRVARDLESLRSSFGRVRTP